MRLLKILLPLLLLTACSWFQKDTGSCLDDDSCEAAVPVVRTQLTGLPWYYCYGVSKDEPWDCSREEDVQKIQPIHDAAASNAATDTPPQEETESQGNL